MSFVSCLSICVFPAWGWKYTSNWTVGVCSLVSLWVCIRPCGERGSVKAQGNELREKQLCAKEKLRTRTFLSLHQKVSLGKEEVERSDWDDVFFWAGFGSCAIGWSDLVCYNFFL